MIKTVEMDLFNKKVTVIGARKSGMAVLKLAKDRAAVLKVSEAAVSSRIPEDDMKWIKNNCFAFEFGGHTREFIEDSDIIILSPSVSIFSDVVKWARSRDIIVLGEIEFAYQFCNKPIIAVTGTSGKTTVSTLIHSLLKNSGYTSYLCGNIGEPFSLYATENDRDFFVVEVSSFQLESIVTDKQQQDRFSIRGFRPYISIFLNFYKNHLDRHKDMKEYFEAKKNIFFNQQKQDYAVLNFADGSIKELASQIGATVTYFNVPNIASKVFSSGNNFTVDNSVINNPNYSAVRVVGQILGINKDICYEVFSKFQGLEHRMELVGCINGVEFVNDSKSTTAESAGWALSCLNKPVIMLCGGRDKGAEFRAIASLVAEKVKKMIVFGEAKDRLQYVFNKIVDIISCDSFEDAVFKAKSVAKEGDVVLLSPMCSSFDMFSNFEERGRVFKELVNSN